jgi:tetratricopeptide (TPR) repeat protein/MFS family permease
MAKGFWSTIVSGASAFLSGGCIAMLAMAVFRMAGTELGMSPYTWMAVLATTLSGLILGGFLGGRLADRFHARRTLSVLYALASAACVLVVVLNNAMVDWVGLWSLSWPWHILLHVILLLLAPALLLGATLPVAGKMASQGGATAGTAMGSVLGSSAGGGLVAMLLAGFFVIPAHGNSVAVWSISIAALAGAFLLWVSCWVLYVWGMVFGVLLFLAASPDPWAIQSSTSMYLRSIAAAGVLYEAQTLHGSVAVEQTSQRPDTRVMWLNGCEQGVVLPGDPTCIQDFPATVIAAVMHERSRPDASPSVLFIGSGGYVLPRYAAALWPRGHVQVIEPDPEAAAAAAMTLKVDATVIESSSVGARAYLRRLQALPKQEKPAGPFDLICTQFSNPLDVSTGLVTRQFHEGLAAILSDDGVYALSLVDSPEQGRFLGAMVCTLEETFPFVQVVARASRSPAAVEKYVVIAGRRAVNPAQAMASYPACEGARVLSQAELDRLKNRCAGLVLTDERAPVESLLLPAARADASFSLARRLFHKAVLLENRSEGDECEAFYERVAGEDTPLRAKAYAAAGRRWLAKEKGSEAGEALTAALKYALEDGESAATIAEIRADLARSLKKMDRLQPAKQHMSAAVKDFQSQTQQHPQSVVAWERLGDAWAFLEGWSEASDAYSRCVDLEPDYLTHYDKLAASLAMQRRYAEAVKVVRTQIALLKKTGRKEAVEQRTQYVESLEFERAKQRG